MLFLKKSTKLDNSTTNKLQNEYSDEAYKSSVRSSNFQAKFTEENAKESTYRENKNSQQKKTLIPIDMIQKIKKFNSSSNINLKISKNRFYTATKETNEEYHKMVNKENISIVPQTEFESLNSLKLRGRLNNQDYEDIPKPTKKKPFGMFENLTTRSQQNLDGFKKKSSFFTVNRTAFKNNPKDVNIFSMTDDNNADVVSTHNSSVSRSSISSKVYEYQMVQQSECTDSIPLITKDEKNSTKHTKSKSTKTNFDFRSIKNKISRSKNTTSPSKTPTNNQTHENDNEQVYEPNISKSNTKGPSLSLFKFPLTFSKRNRSQPSHQKPHIMDDYTKNEYVFENKQSQKDTELEFDSYSNSENNEEDEEFNNLNIEERVPISPISKIPDLEKLEIDTKNFMLPRVNITSETKGLISESLTTDISSQKPNEPRLNINLENFSSNEDDNLDDFTSSIFSKIDENKNNLPRPVLKLKISQKHPDLRIQTQLGNLGNNLNNGNSGGNNNLTGVSSYKENSSENLFFNNLNNPNCLMKNSPSALSMGTLMPSNTIKSAKLGIRSNKTGPIPNIEF
ncbi:hypothetical protein BB559_002216 [Furculomyces boomerangus]|uniref:Uncharacterized protein n=1 Tax=Furculomyces boomerangus TaxID=61424 RepID=A0A2T9YX20_9FUNG|nr:hypothetical protein BB559_002216 [Furculomyces boomerangus]